MLFVPSRLTNDYSASAPEMISISSLVICAWRGAVIFHGQAIDHVAGVAGGVVHRAHARALLGGRVLEQRLEDLHGDVERQEIGQDLGLVGLVFVDGAAKRSLGVRWYRRGSWRG